MGGPSREVSMMDRAALQSFARIPVMLKPWPSAAAQAVPFEYFHCWWEASFPELQKIQWVTALMFLFRDDDRDNKHNYNRNNNNNNNMRK